MDAFSSSTEQMGNRPGKLVPKRSSIAWTHLGLFTEFVSYGSLSRKSRQELEGWALISTTCSSKCLSQ